MTRKKIISKKALSTPSIELKFKDKCDNCKEFNYLRGVEDKCLCEKCIEELTKKNEEK